MVFRPIFKIVMTVLSMVRMVLRCRIKVKNVLRMVKMVIIKVRKVVIMVKIVKYFDIVELGWLSVDKYKLSKPKTNIALNTI